MTNQEFFDAAVAHLRRQGQHSGKGPNTGCSYWHPETQRMCAVGGVMPEAMRLRLWREGDKNGTRIDCLLDEDKEVADFFADVDPDLLCAMQRLHDTYQVAEWEPRLKALAPQYNLVYTPPAEQAK